MSDILSKINTSLNPLGLQALDFLFHMQMRCTCGQVLIFEPNCLNVLCSCGHSYLINILICAKCNHGELL